MRRLPWHVSVRADRKAMLTATGIALGVAFSIIGFALASALEGESISEEGRFSKPDFIVARADGEPLDARALEGLELAVLLVEATTHDGRNVTLAGIEGPRAVEIFPGSARPATIDVRGELLLSSPEAMFLLESTIADARLGRGWFVVNAPELRALVGAPEGAATYALTSVRPPSSELVTQEAPALEPFFRASGVEVARDLGLVVAFSSLLVSLFAYEFLRTEVRERRREIALWRSIGMRIADVGALLLGRGIFIAATGTVAGFALALGTLGAAARVTGSAVFQGRLSPAIAALLFACFVLAGTLGAIVPAIGAARRPVRESLEAVE